MNRDPKIQSEYTEQEAKDEVVSAARDLEAALSDSMNEAAWISFGDSGGTIKDALNSLRSALVLVDTYKGVR